ncbi:BnaC09g20930D [Brassica napus]|uniref:BnaC09g20930D protein n=1 Tax=Brassica napus TaxID=3708 RepID=A0A078FWC3_BRANA|nr:BnaC09g20930D [Brassica napus]
MTIHKNFIRQMDMQLRFWWYSTGWPRKLIIDCACAEKMNRSCVFLAAQSLCLFATRVRSETGRYEDEKIRSLEEIRSWGRRNGRRS